MLRSLREQLAQTVADSLPNYENNDKYYEDNGLTVGQHQLKLSFTEQSAVICNPQDQDSCPFPISGRSSETAKAHRG
eukprot:TRINITY_DN3233_c0_g1_i1.p1 TRINITY_DN3233_c0_g1~~TRINITY_DN3233_c0_g1_i1.p1  ORF type:complete len:77 (+),score=21.37 TRINITY_DN3233_c0_g1_i1:16-246(+)